MNSARRVDFDPLSRDFGSCESFFLTNIYQLLCNEQTTGWHIPRTVVYRCGFILNPQPPAPSPPTLQPFAPTAPPLPRCSRATARGVSL